MKLGPWRESAATPEEVRAAKLFEAAARVDVPPPPPFTALATVPRPRSPRVLVKALVVLLGAGALWAMWPAKREVVAVPPVGVPPVAAVVVEAPRVVEAFEPDVEPMAPPRPARRVPQAKVMPKPIVESVVPRKSTLGEEAGLISAALQALRQANNPSRALEILGEYHARFPEGVLRHEALLAQAQTERARRHPEAALALLDAVVLDANEDVAGELEVTRGELLAELHRCPEAEAAFARALESTLRSALAERGAWGRASCSAQRSSPDAPRLLRAFLSDFPDSAHANEATELLSSVQAPSP